MIPTPTPERVGRGARHWFVWFAVSNGSARRFKLVMVSRG